MKVLIVEDEALVRFVGAEAAIDAGYEVLEAESADEALKILEQADEVGILFSDIRMPGSMDGLELAKVVHDRWPKIGILLTSGDTFPDFAEMPDDGRFLPKPFRMENLKRELAIVQPDE